MRDARRGRFLSVRTFARAVMVFLTVPCLHSGEPATANPELSGGEATVFDVSAEAFGFPISGLSEESRAAFFVGRSFFRGNWVVAGPPVTRAGLGPFFNARSCSACHGNDGRGRPPEAGRPLLEVLMRISVPGFDAHRRPSPDPVYGGQIAGQAIPGVSREADVVASYTDVHGQFADGESYTLRRPTYTVTNLGYGPLAEDALLSPRVAPAVIGLGLLEAVPESQLHAIAKEQADSGTGVNGRLNSVWDIAAGRMVAGRFGWKAEQPSVLQQTAGAFNEDM